MASQLPFKLPSTRALLLAVLFTLSAHANPIPGPDSGTTEEISQCATILCMAGTDCKVIDGRAQCIPINPKPEVCGKTVCAAGLICCNASCGICTKPGMMCTQQACNDDGPKGEKCGSVFCKPGTECCNPSCGTCVAPGKGCTKQLCLPDPPKQEQCGKTVCPEGFVCCNSSCGTCTPPGGACTQQFCTN
ncbi:hypothetical protein N656DRAFT_774328 [Canariomyces notabilis]|uniref:Uncharacterized protein n=1 Tax=Canariomyces notabilis TaxID=2074819 RepID=A0AAN6TLF8_9PEZI|nr:hypothetical protein N656DRAFT_774328 [Canariomyces arenarius]